MTVTDAALRRQLRLLAKPAALLQRVVARAGKAHPSYLGGLPKLPKGMDWPQRLDGWHMSFLGQVDLGSLAGLPVGKELPERGSLLFFADTDPERCEGYRLDGRVIFAPRTTKGVKESGPPARLMLRMGGLEAGSFPWADETELAHPLATLFPRWPLEPVGVRTFRPYYRDWTPEDDEEDYIDAAGRYDELRKEEQGKAWRTALDPAPPHIRSGGLRQPRPGGGLDGLCAAEEWGKLWLPDAGWPQLWVHVRVAARELLDRAERFEAEPHVADAAETWMRRAALDVAFAPVPAEVAAEFRAWLAGLWEDGDAAQAYRRQQALLINSAIEDAVVVGADAAFGYAPDATRLPALARAVAENRAAVFEADGRGVPLYRHQVLGYAEPIQDEAEYLERTHRLLMQFDSEWATFSMWGDAGTIAYWIRPADLKTARFDRVVLTTASH